MALKCDGQIFQERLILGQSGRLGNDDFLISMEYTIKMNAFFWFNFARHGLVSSDRG